jgi:hypothetical protein
MVQNKNAKSSGTIGKFRFTGTPIDKSIYSKGCFKIFGRDNDHRLRTSPSPSTQSWQALQELVECIFVGREEYFKGCSFI